MSRSTSGPTSSRNASAARQRSPSIGNPPYLPNFWANDLVWTVLDHNDTKQYAVFGQIDIDVTPTLHVGIGDRYVKAKERFTESGGGFFDFGGGGTGTWRQ